MPVVIVLVPVFERLGGSEPLRATDTAGRFGVLTVRRAISPHLGKLALPGGYVDFGERWQDAGARELQEEAGLVVDPALLIPITVFSAADNTLIVAAIAPAIAAASMATFSPNAESSERIVLFEPQPLAFPLHTELVTRFLEGKPLGYSVVNSVGKLGVKCGDDAISPASPLT